MGKLVHIHPDNPQPAALEQAVDLLAQGGIVIYPTDTLYGMGCAIDQVKTIEKIILAKGLKSKTARFSFICSSIAQVAEFARVGDGVFRLLKDNLPGPFTFILFGLSKVPDYFLTKRKTVGVRIPDCSIPRKLVEGLGVPILTTSLPYHDDEPAYIQYPELMAERWGHLVDMIIDGGVGELRPSTVVDCTQDQLVIVRQGKGLLKQ
jgi:sua5/yciO/yrdC/ywlC family protein